MANGHGGERGVGEQPLKPFDARQVKMVGGLVEQHHVRIAHQGFNNRKALAPTAGEGSGLGVEIRESGPAGQFAKPAFARALVLERRLFVGGHESLFQHLADAEAGSKTRVLRNIGGAGALAHGHLAGVGFHLPGQQRQQSGLARAIRPDQADTVAILHGEGDVEKKRLGAELLGDGLRVENWRHLIKSIV